MRIVVSDHSPTPELKDNCGLAKHHVLQETSVVSVSDNAVGHPQCIKHSDDFASSAHGITCFRSAAEISVPLKSLSASPSPKTALHKQPPRRGPTNIWPVLTVTAVITADFGVPSCISRIQTVYVYLLLHQRDVSVLSACALNSVRRDLEGDDRGPFDVPYQHLSADSIIRVTGRGHP
jgi:hypothetical protein